MRGLISVPYPCKLVFHSTDQTYVFGTPHFNLKALLPPPLLLIDEGQLCSCKPVWPFRSSLGVAHWPEHPRRDNYHTSWQTIFCQPLSRPKESIGLKVRWKKQDINMNICVKPFHNITDTQIMADFKVTDIVYRVWAANRISNTVLALTLMRGVSDSYLTSTNHVTNKVNDCEISNWQ